MNSKDAKRMDRFSQLSVACAKMAIEDAGLKIKESDNGKIGVISGSALGGMPYAESQHSIFMEKGLKRIDPLLAIKLFPGESASLYFD